MVGVTRFQQRPGGVPLGSHSLTILQKVPHTVHEIVPPHDDVSPCSPDGRLLRKGQQVAEGLTVLGVNISDTEAQFKGTLKLQGIEYPQIHIPAHVKENGATLYNVKSIPHIMLIAPDGTILKRGLRGEEMMKYIDEIMNEKK
jgi:hypothetical protein